MLIVSFFSSLLETEDFALDENDIISAIPPEICELREKRLKKFIVDCPTQKGRGVGNWTDYSEGGVDTLMEVESNCFTICRRGS